MDKTSLTLLITQVLTAFGTFFILLQIYLYRRNYKAESVKQLFQTFFTSPHLNEFSICILKALDGIDAKNSLNNNHTRKELIKDLSDYNTERSHQALLYSRFLGYIYYSIDNKLISPEDVVGINGKWIKDYYSIRNYVEMYHLNDFTDDRIKEYWPIIPKELQKQINALSK